MKNFLKGIFVGIFNIIPGLSGSALLIILNLYNKSIEAISNIIKNPKKNIQFLLPIGLGIILGTYLFSKIILLSLNKYPSETLTIFTGFLLGTIPHLIKEATKKGYKKNYIIPFIITFLIGTSLTLIKKENITYQINYTQIELIKYFLIGTILSISTIIPGISSTILLSLFNLYGIYIYSISSLNLFVLIPSIIGFTITSFLIAKLINYLIKNHYGYTYFAIIGFTIGSIPSLLKINSSPIPSIILGLIAFIITNKTFKILNKK